MELHTYYLTAFDLLRKHNLNDWKLVVKNMKKTFGLCSHREKSIYIAKSFVEQGDEVDVYDTLKHEIAHALVGGGNGHNHIWKAKAIEVGARPVRCGKSDLVKLLPQGKYQAKCTNSACDVVCNMHRKPKYTIYICIKCKKLGRVGEFIFPKEVVRIKKYTPVSSKFDPLGDLFNI